MIREVNGRWLSMDDVEGAEDGWSSISLILRPRSSIRLYITLVYNVLLEMDGRWLSAGGIGLRRGGTSAYP